QHFGRGGWTWYSGSAGWVYRLITESLLGLRLEVDRLRLQPVLPMKWPSLKIHYRYRETFHHILIRNRQPATDAKPRAAEPTSVEPARSGLPTVQRVIFDGVERTDGTIPLVDDRQDHHAEVDLG